MKIFKCFYIILNVFIYFNLICSDEMMNVGTTLFTASDNSRVCWSTEQLSLLRARMIYQDVLPRTSCISMNNGDFIIALINYFRMAVVKVKSMTTGRTTDINLMALTDTIGGYLRSVILPIAKMSYYDGNINYEIIGNLIQLYEEIKTYLHTDGKNWAPPQKLRTKREIRPLPQIIENSPSSDPCGALVYSTDKDGIHVPMPFFDSKSRPSSIAVPFKTYPLRNLNSKCAVLILVRYYLTVSKCLESKHSNKNAIDKFNKDYEAFLDSQVIPLLKDEKIYPAFGSVYRIKESINKAVSGVEKASYIAAQPSVESLVELSSEEDQRAAMILLICIITVVFLWMIITLIYCFLKRRLGKGFFIKKRPLSSNSPGRSQLSLRPRKLKKEDKKSTTCSSPSTPKKKHTQINPPVVKKICPRCKRDTCDNANCNLSTFAKFFSAKAENPVPGNRCQNCPPLGSRRKCKLCKRKDCTKSSASMLKLATSKSESQKPSQKSSSPSRSSPRESIKIKQKQIAERNKKCKNPKDKCCKSSPGSEAQLRPEKKVRAQTHFMFNMASMFNKGPAKIVKSAPVSGKNASLYSEEKKTSTSSNTTTTTSEEKPLVFGYDFETTTSESSSLEDSSASSSPRRLVKFDT